MKKKDEKSIFQAVILTISDKCIVESKEDKAGKIVKSMIEENKGEIIDYKIIGDNQKEIEEKLIHYADTMKIKLVLTNGGTGLTTKDFTPEATKKVIEKEIPGIPEAMRTECLRITKKAMVSRGVAGIRSQTLIINLPGSSNGAKESLEVIIKEIPYLLKAISLKPK